MRKVLLSIVWCLCAAGFAHGALIQHDFVPTPADLGDLDHYHAYTWGVKWSWDNEVINSATLSIRNLNDWQVEPDDVLYIHLLDSAAQGVKTHSDTAAGDWFAGQGILMTTYSDPDTGPNPAVNWFYQFTPQDIDTLRSYATGGGFGLGFDPDCHFYNTGVELTIMTHTPEPAGLMIAGLALTPLLYGKRR